MQACAKSPDSHPLQAQESFQTAVCVYMRTKEINNANHRCGIQPGWVSVHLSGHLVWAQRGPWAVPNSRENFLETGEVVDGVTETSLWRRVFGEGKLRRRG